MTNMNKKQLQEFKQAFVERKLKIVEDLSDTKEVDISGDDTDRIQGEMIGGLIEKQNIMKARQLYAINIALEKIENNTFGTCEECEEDIGIKRLLAVPDAELCIVCAEKLEREAKEHKR